MTEGNPGGMTAFVHKTVMRSEVAQAIAPRAGALYADVTLGGGGHTEALLEAAECRVIGVDRDETAIAAAKARLARFGDRFEARRGRFGDAAVLLPTGLDGLVADLGVSSPQLDDPSRGMSLKREASDAPLDMRMDRSTGETARELIIRLSEEELADVIFELGEERQSRRIARAIKRADKLETTGDLRHAVWSAVGGEKRHGIDPATRTFQALRIAVNEEMGELDRLIEALPGLLAPNGVAAIISFHSLEDRKVKRAFSDAAIWAPLTKKPIEARPEEITENARARSAKLRVARRRRPDGEGESEGSDRAAKYAARKARKFGGGTP